LKHISQPSVVKLNDPFHGETVDRAFDVSWNRNLKNFGAMLSAPGSDEGTLYFFSRALFFASTEKKSDGTPKHLYIPLGPGNRFADSITVVKNCASNEHPHDFAISISGVTEGAYDDTTELRDTKRPRPLTNMGPQKPQQRADKSTQPDSKGVIVFTGIAKARFKDFWAMLKDLYRLSTPKRATAQENRSPSAQYEGLGKKRTLDGEDVDRDLVAAQPIRLELKTMRIT
ncbi:hypothetical protein LTS12_027529, partial [Elasticomyces elasticus]